jgi:NADH dehydrogenase
VVIAGAGFGGLTCARALRHVPVDVLLVDRNNYHLFTPLLYQVASALLDPGEIARPVRELIRPIPNGEFRQAEVTGADLDRRILLTDRGPIPYDYLVLATGSQSDYFGNASLKQHAFGLKDLGEGLALRNRILSQFEASRWVTDVEKRRTMLTSPWWARVDRRRAAGALRADPASAARGHRDLDLARWRCCPRGARRAPARSS